MLANPYSIEGGADNQVDSLVMVAMSTAVCRECDLASTVGMEPEEHYKD